LRPASATYYDISKNFVTAQLSCCSRHLHALLQTRNAAPPLAVNCRLAWANAAVKIQQRLISIDHSVGVLRYLADDSGGFPKSRTLWVGVRETECRTACTWKDGPMSCKAIHGGAWCGSHDSDIRQQRSHQAPVGCWLALTAHVECCLLTATCIRRRHCMAPYHCAGSGYPEIQNSSNGAFFISFWPSQQSQQYPVSSKKTRRIHYIRNPRRRRGTPSHERGVFVWRGGEGDKNRREDEIEFGHGLTHPLTSP
jgi:hypothetical protein